MTTAVTLHEAQTAAVAQITPQRAVGLLRPLADPGEIIGAQNATREFVHQALKEGRDYGPIPGTEKKAMLKPGAERTALAFGCYYGDPEIVEQEIDHDREVKWRKAKNKYDWTGGKKGRKIGEEVVEGVSLGLYRYVVKVPVIHAESGRIVAVGVGSCSSMESKYVDRPRDSENTILKMAHKRALVAACLLAFGLSDEFTQDVEDMPHIAEAAEGGEASGETGAEPAGTEPEAQCPKCGGKMWDNRATKRSAKAPDFKCRDRACDGVYWPGQWPPKKEETKAQASTASKSPADLVFPKSKAFPELEGKKLGAIATEQLEAAYTATLEKAPALAASIADVLEARRLELELNDRQPAAPAPTTMPKPGAVGDALGDLKIQRLRGEINELLPRADLGLVKAIGSVVDNPNATAEQLERALARVTESIRKAEAAAPAPAAPKAGLADDDLPF